MASRRKIKKQQKKELINRKVLQRIIRESNICQHAIKELKLAGYDKKEGGPDDWMCQQVLEAVAVFASHNNSNHSAPFEINLVQKLCSYDIITPLHFTDDEWMLSSYRGIYQNKRKSSIFRLPNGNIEYIDAFNKKPIRRYSFSTEEWTENENSICWRGGLFEHKDNVLTGRYFDTCYLWKSVLSNGWMPKPKRTINCIEVEIDSNNWIMAVDANNIDLIVLSVEYNIQWKECPCMKGVRLEDVTPELEKKAYEEIDSNK